MSKKITKRGRYIMKVLMLNGSPRTKGNTFIALEEMKKVFEVEGVEAEIVQVDVVWNLANVFLMMW